MKEEFNSIKRILDEHLNSINDNTDEIQVLFDYLHDIETKMDRLSSRLDQLQMSQNSSIEKMKVSPLTTDEKKIFLVLYTEEHRITFEEIAKKSHLSNPIVKEKLNTLVEKGIPLERFYSNGQFFFSITKEFKDIQAKENLVNLSLESFM